MVEIFANKLMKIYAHVLGLTIVKYVNDHQDNWNEFLDPILLAYRTSIHKPTKESPLFSAFGKKLLTDEEFPVGAQDGSHDPDHDPQTGLGERIAGTVGIFESHVQARDNIKLARSKQQKNDDDHREAPAYKVGDLVLIDNSRRNNRKGDKL